MRQGLRLLALAVLPGFLFFGPEQTSMAQVGAGVPLLTPVAQVDRVAASADMSVKASLRGHVPGWATAGREVAGRSVDLSSTVRVSITLQRDAAVQAAFETLLAEQQDPKSALYQHWLTSTEVGELYGPTQHDVDALAGWLRSQGLTVIDVAPSRMLIDAEASAAVVGNAFQTSFAYYKVGENERRSARTEPVVPAALVPVIAAIGGLAEMVTEPLVHQQLLANPERYQRVKADGTGVVAAPDYTASTTVYYMTAGDFDTIYDINSVVTGGNTGATVGSVTNSNCPVSTAQCVAIIGRSRVTTADITNYMTSYGANGETSYHLTQTAVPSGSGGVDPGITYDSNTSEATLDVQRVVGTANGAQAVLVVSSTTGGTDGVDIATNYNVNTLMYPVMTLSFGLCEAGSSSAQQTSRQSIFSQAAAEGIATFVSAGDSAAAGCDAAFTAPPATQYRSTNYLCATGYVTCVGGTEFADASAYSTYWNSANGTQGLSAKSYIPEGAWNEPGTSGAYEVAGTGGGVSTYVTKPAFQTGTGVPADGYRDTPDVAFSAANHDGYLGQLTTSNGGTQATYVNSGTSAAAPGMAAIAALLNTKLGRQAGNLNPLIYKLAATNASAFHDATPTSSGVGTCSTGTASMCNNSTPGTVNSLSGGVVGYALTTGYDQATGWGSLDVANFLTAADAAALTVASAHTGNFAIGSTGDVYTLTVTNSGGTATSGTISVVDTLPSGFTATALSGSGWTCTVGTLTCTESTALAAGASAAAITLTVSVASGETAGTYSNSVTVSLGGVLSDTATDPTVVPSATLPATLTETFSPAAIAVGATSTMAFTYANPNASVTLTGVGFSDTLSAYPSIAISTETEYACTSGSSSPSFSYNAAGFTLPATASLGSGGGYCILAFSVTGNTAGMYVNPSSTISSSGGTGAAATATLVVGAELNAASTHTGSFKAGDAADTYSLTVTNSASSGAATSGTVTVVDTLPTGFTATAMSGTGWSCTVSTKTCTRTDALAIGSSYPVITLTVSVAATDVGTYTNSVTASGGGGFSGGAGTDATLVIGEPTIAEGLSPTSIGEGGTTTMTITLGNPAGDPVTLTGVGFTDALPTGLVVGTPNGASTTCSGGTLTAVAASGSVTLSGASLTAGATCTVTVTLTSTTPGSYTNTTGAVTAANANAGAAASAMLTVTAVPTKLVFTPAPTTLTAGGSPGTVTISLEDASGNVATTYSSTVVTLSYTGPASANGSFMATSANGVATFNLSPLTLTVAGTYPFQATASGLTLATANLVVTAAAATRLGVSSPTAVFYYPGQVDTVTVTALDSYNNTATSYTGTVTITSSDTAAGLPAAYTYSAGDAGVHAFAVTLNTAGSSSVSANGSGVSQATLNGTLVEDSIWLVDGTGYDVKLSSQGTLVTAGGVTSTASAHGGLAMDALGNVWSAESASNTLVSVSKTAGGATQYTGGGLSAPVSVAVDGGGYLWVADSGNHSVSEFKNSGAAVSGTSGLGAASIGTAPSGVALDESGGVWVVSKTSGTVTHLLGAASPVTTPLVTAAKTAKLGTEP